MPQKAELSLGPMRREEVDMLVGWAADEGWNPGISDIGIAWDTDPEAFIALQRGSDLAGGGTIIRYGDHYGFMGLFIVRRDLRGDGLGGQLWRYRLKCLQDRLAPGATIGMDGVFAMVPFYQHGDLNLLITMCVTRALRTGRLIPRFDGSMRRTSTLSIALMESTYPRKGLHFFAVGFFSRAPMRLAYLRRIS